MKNIPKFNSCPFCGSGDVRSESVPGGFYMTCTACHACGPECKTLAEAADSWNDPNFAVYLKHRFREADLVFGQLLITAQTAVIELRNGTGAEAAMQWIIDRLAGPGELPAETETDARAFFEREMATINNKLDLIYRYFEDRKNGREGGSC